MPRQAEQAPRAVQPATADDLNPASPNIHYTAAHPRVLVYSGYIKSCRISTISSRAAPCSTFRAEGSDIRIPTSFENFPEFQECPRWLHSSQNQKACPLLQADLVKAFGGLGVANP